MSIILFFLVLFVLVLVHEWGHFIVAKKTGMRVDEFGIGFPPKLFGVKWRETTYTFNALPIGGFVKIWGENGDEPVSPVESEVNDLQPAASAEADESGTKVVSAGRAFSDRPKWAQALVLIAGVTMNIIFAWILFSASYMIGIPTAVDEATASPEADLYLAAVLPDSPASVIPVGAVISTVAGGEVVIDSPTPTEFSDFVITQAPEAVQVTYEYKKQTEVVSLAPVQGLVADDADRYVIGASLSLVEVQRQGVVEALSNGAKSTYAGFIGIAGGLAALIQQTFVGQADFSQVAGPIGIVGMVGDAAAFGLTTLLTFTAIISLNLAVINLLPFPALDGGRLVFVAIETITGRRIPPEWAGRVNLAGFALLMLLMIAVTYNDIIRLI